MIPAAPSIVRARYWTKVAIRVIAVAWFLVDARDQPAVLASIFTNIFPVFNGNNGFAPYFMSNFITSIASLIGAMIVPASLLLFQNRLVRWLIPTPKLGCPNCGYPVANLKSPVCPECGVDIRPHAQAR